MIVLLDAGPLVALLKRGDEWHEWARDTLGAITHPFATCEPVLAEAAWLLRKTPGAPAAVLELVVREFVRVPFQAEREATSLQALMTRYASVPMSLADACLVRMSELEPRSSVLTLDADFRVYRRHGRSTIPLITPHLSRP